jgi:hypothetical protein
MPNTLAYYGVEKITCVFFTESDVHIFYVHPSLIFGGKAKEPTLRGMIQSSPQILVYDSRTL